MARLRDIRWSRKAVRQVERIGEQIEIDSPWQAGRVVSVLFSTPEKLLWSPRKGRIVPEFSDENLREVTVFSWRFIYRLIGEETLEVVAVIHGQRILTPSLLG